MARTPKTAPILQTNRLRLRPFRASDLKATHALYGDGENLRYWGVAPSPSLDSTRKMMRWHISCAPAHYIIWAIEEKVGKRVVGMINYHRREMREKRVEVGWLIVPAMQGKGYMT